MLGYVRIDKPELKVREYEVYTGYYCGVCKYIGKTYGQLPRMALSYDAAFLALLLASLDETSDAPVQEHCIAHHIQKKTVIRNKAIEYAGDVMLILAWYKLLDDAHDEGKVSAKATAVLLKRIFKKLRRKHPDLCNGVEAHLQTLSSLEQSKCDSLDMVAEEFSKIMEVIFAEGGKYLYGEPPAKEDISESGDIFLSIDEDLTPTEALAKIGYHLGKWVYIIDAADDIEDNIETGAYNPLIYRFEFNADKESPEQFRERIREPLNFNLYHYLAVLSNCVNNLDIKKNKGIIDNVIYFGLNQKTEEIIRRN